DGLPDGDLFRVGAGGDVFGVDVGDRAHGDEVGLADFAPRAHAGTEAPDIEGLRAGGAFHGDFGRRRVGGRRFFQALRREDPKLDQRVAQADRAPLPRFLSLPLAAQLDLV